MSAVMVVPAAGRGSRLGSSKPKALVEVLGRPMIDHVLERYRDHVSRFLVVAGGAAADLVRAHCARRSEVIDVFVQEHPTGMLDAILIPHRALQSAPPTWVWITWCDQVGVLPETTVRLAACVEATRPAAALPTVHVASPYIHFDRGSGGRLHGVRQRREGDAMPPRGEADIGLFVLSGATYLDDLPEFARDAPAGASTGERAFLPFFPWLAGHGAVVDTIEASSPEEALGVNTPEDLRRVEGLLGARAREQEGGGAGS